MVRLGDNKRSKLIRAELETIKGNGVKDYAVTCRNVQDIVANALPSRISDREKLEWISNVSAIIK